jgi:O-antigen/teichoic acid export membrane protein
LTFATKGKPLTQFIARFRDRLRRYGSMFLYSGSNLLVQVTTFACQLVVLRFVPPELMGIWAAAVLVNTLLLFSRLGIINAMNREYPYFLGRDEREKAQQTVQTALAYTLVNAAGLFLVFTVLGFVYIGRRWEWPLAFFGMGVSSSIQQYSVYLEGTFMAGNQFRRLALLRLLQIPVLAVTIVLPWRFGFSGFVMRQLTIGSIVAAACFAWRPVRVWPAFRKGYLRLLLTMGWRLFLSNYVIQQGLAFPRWALLALSGTRYLGLFAPVNAMYLALMGISGSFSAYLYPNLTYRYAKSHIPVGRLAMKAAVISMLLFLPGVLAGLFVLPWLLPKMLPKYAAATSAAQVALVAGMFECMSIANIAFAVTKSWKPMYVYLVCVLVVRSLGAFGGCMMLSDSLLGVAFGILASSMVMGMVTWLTVRKTVSKAPDAAQVD